jgi:uncharacterized membrane protein
MARRKRSKASVEKRERELEHKREVNAETMRRLLIVVIIVAIIAVAWWTFGGTDDGNGPGPTEGLTVNSQGEVEIPESEVTKEARFYSIDADGVPVKFFAVRGSDGDIRVAMDACDVCYGHKKGYEQSGDDMVCINCGNKYPTDGIGTENKQGGCWPSYIPIKVEEGKVIIKESDLRAKAYMFD